MKFNLSIDDLINEFGLEVDFEKYSTNTKEKSKIVENKKEEAKIYKNTTTFEAYKKHEVEQYKKISKDKEYKQFLYAKQMLVTNTKLNEQYSLSHDILQKAKDTYLYFFYTQKIMEEKYANNSDYVAIFLTLTTPSQFHKYSVTTQKANSNFDSNTTINEAYRLLNSSFREIYKDFKINRKFEKIEYSKVIEPHQNLTPHLHAIIYVKKDYLENMKNHINNIIKKNELGEHKIEVLENTSRGCAYLLKYVQKTTNPKCEDDFHFFNGWKKANKIRVFTSSASILNRAIYKKINSVTGLSKGLKDKNPITNILENCYIKTKQKNYIIGENFDYVEDGETKKTKGNKEGRYEAIIKKERIKKINFYGNSFYNVLNLQRGFKKEDILRGDKWSFKRFLFVFEDTQKIKLDKKELLEKFEIYQKSLKNNNRISLYELMFKDLCITKTLYKIIDFKIYDKVKKELIYNKKDFELEKDLEINFKTFKYEYEKEAYYTQKYGDSFFALDLI